MPRPARRKASSKSEARLRADELAHKRGRHGGTPALSGSTTLKAASPCNKDLRANPFDLRDDDGDSDGYEDDDGRGILEPETDAFDDLPPLERLSVPVPLTAMDWSPAAPNTYTLRGRTKTLPRFVPSAAARAFPVYQMMAKRQLDTFTRKQLIDRGAASVGKMLRPLSAATNAQLFGAYQHGLLSRDVICSRRPADIYKVMCVLGSASFARQHMQDIEAAAARGGLDESTAGQHWGYCGNTCSLSDCSVPFVAQPGDAVPTAETVRMLYRQRAARCKVAASDVTRARRPTFALCQQQCGARLDIDAMSALHHSAMEAAAQLNPDNPRATLPALVKELGPAALLCVKAADLESAQLGLLLSISLPACVRQGTVVGLYADAFVPALSTADAPPSDGGSVAADRVHCKIPVHAGARLMLRPGVWAAARVFFQLRCPVVGAAAPRHRVTPAVQRLALQPLAIDVAATAAALVRAVPAVAGMSAAAAAAAMRRRPELVREVNVAALQLAAEDGPVPPWPVPASSGHLLCQLRQAVTTAYGRRPCWANMADAKLSNIDWRWVRRGAITAFLSAWKEWRAELFGGALPVALWRAEDAAAAHEAVADAAFTGADQIRDSYLMGGL